MRTHAERSDPSRREHFVYRCFDARGRLLYVGCTMRPALRAKEHRDDHQPWLQAVARVRMVGPTDYATARQWERDALRDEYPAYGITPQRRGANARRDRWISRRVAELMVAGVSSNDACSVAVIQADCMDWGATPEGQWPKQEVAA